MCYKYNMSEKQKKREILFAHDAWWFLHSHPALRLNVRTVVDSRTAVRNNNQNLYIEKTLDDGSSFRIYDHAHLFHYALDCNLNIHYTHVDDKGNVSDKKSENIYTACWLEFGRLQYDSDTLETRGQLDHINHNHDWELDCGGPTFDEALVKLANNVLKYYGDYVDDNDGYDTCGGKATCKDCSNAESIVKRMRLR